MYFQIALRSPGRRTFFAYLACLGALSLAGGLLTLLLAPPGDGRTRRERELGIKEERWVPPATSADWARNQRVAERRERTLSSMSLAMGLILAGAAMLCVGSLPFVVLSD